MKNRLYDLNNHLFAQLERLSDETLSAEQLEVETKRAAAIVDIADQIVANAHLQIKAAELVAEHGAAAGRILAPMIEGSKPALDAPRTEAARPETAP